MARRARSCCSGRAGAGTRPRAPTAGSRGSATLGAAHHSCGVSPTPMTRLEAPPSEILHPRRLRRAPEQTRAAGRGRSAPRAPGKERKLKRARAELRFTPKFPV